MKVREGEVIKYLASLQIFQTFDPSSLLSTVFGSPETQEQVLAEWNDWQHDEPASTGPRLRCDECGKTFTRPDDLNRHMKMHSDKEHECSRCHKKLNRKVRDLQGYISKHNKAF